MRVDTFCDQHVREGQPHSSRQHSVCPRRDPGGRGIARSRSLIASVLIALSPPPYLVPLTHPHSLSLPLSVSISRCVGTAVLSSSPLGVATGCRALASTKHCSTSTKYCSLASKLPCLHRRHWMSSSVKIHSASSSAPVTSRSVSCPFSYLEKHPRSGSGERVRQARLMNGQGHKCSP